MGQGGNASATNNNVTEVYVQGGSGGGADFSSLIGIVGAFAQSSGGNGPYAAYATSACSTCGGDGGGQTVYHTREVVRESAPAQCSENYEGRDGKVYSRPIDCRDAAPENRQPKPMTK